MLMQQGWGIIQCAARADGCKPPPPACRSYKKLWDQDKDAYIRRYEKAQKPLSSYEMDIKESMNKEVCCLWVWVW
jgi:hypothetical protein